MVARIKKTIPLPEVPSASGIEIVKSLIYLIGDDSNFLYLLNLDYIFIRKIKLYHSNFIIGDRITKKHKYDLEALTAIHYNNQHSLISIGSGSSKQREKGFLINLNSDNDIKAFSLSSFYEALRSKLGNKGKLNIEGLANDAERLFFFQRGNISKENMLFTVETKAFLHYIHHQDLPLPDFSIRHFDLPSIQNILSGFSGGCILSGSSKLLFTASVENTQDEISDGQSLGSFIGIIDLKTEYNLQFCEVTYDNGNIYRGKIESITILKADQKAIQVLCVSDMDGGISEMMEIEIVL